MGIGARSVALGAALCCLSVVACTSNQGAAGSDAGTADAPAHRDGPIERPEGGRRVGDSGHPPSDGGKKPDAPSTEAGAGPAILSGAIQKGPFVIGSTVELSAIDATGSPTGASFNTQTTDNLGDFSVSFSYRGYVDLQASGFYYNEVTGALSVAPITLHALYDVESGGEQNAYINVVTHLAHERALTLMSQGMSLSAAEAQAESELEAALGIGGTGFNPSGAGTSLNEIGGDTDQNAYLFAVSALLVQTVVETGTASVDAQLQQLLNTIASDLAPSGTLPSSVTAPIQAAQRTLDIDLVTDLFAARLASLGSNAPVANLDRAIDSDGDGYRNAIDTCPLVANPTQGVIPSGLLCTLTRRTTFVPAGTATSAILGDFTNVGHPGVLLPNISGQPASPFLFLTGDGTGRFGAGVSGTLPVGSTTLTPADVNKDGNLDLVALSGWIPGDGAGHFGALVPFGVTFLSVAVADFNQDGWLDIAGVVSPGTINVLLATIPGVFGAPNVFSTPAYGYWVLPADLNHDGRMDLIVGDVSGLVVSMLGDGTGELTTFAQTQLTLPVGAQDAGNPSLGDIDGDGNLDIVVTWLPGNPMMSLTVAFGDGAGSFASPATTTLSPGAIVLGDFNADGKADVWSVASSACDDTTTVLLSAGRSFLAPQTLPQPSQADCGPGLVAQIGTVVSGDVNGDGIPDVVLATAPSVQAFVMAVMPDAPCSGDTCHLACVDPETNFFNCGGCGKPCALGAACIDGACACQGTESSCNGSCVDLQSNVGSCGSCDHSCDVGAGEVCQAGSCACPGNGTLCDAACAILSSDPNNCGACGKQCTGGEVCSGGSCVCPIGESLCGGTCVDESTDSSNCGGCGTQCTTAGQGCVGGSCACAPGWGVCGGQCISESSDPDNCGGCGVRCAVSGQTCVAGECVCPAGDSICNGVCVDESNDTSNCGGCGTQCTVPGQVCTGGSCGCPTGDTVCNGACVDESTDDTNCGGCGQQCSDPSLPFCSNGSCVACPAGNCATSANGHVCLANGTCGCQTEQDCPAAHACLNGTCSFACTLESPCNGTCCYGAAAGEGCCYLGAGLPGCGAPASVVCGPPGGACVLCGAFGSCAPGGGCG